MFRLLSFFTLASFFTKAQTAIYREKICDFIQEEVDTLIQNGGIFTISDTYSNSGSAWEVDWTEDYIFQSLLKYEDHSNQNQSFELRMGKGGQVYSFRTSGFGEALPPQWRPSFDSSGANTSDSGISNPVKSHHGNWAPWNDEAWHFVGSDQRDLLNNVVKTRNIHQGGSYMNNFSHRNSDLTLKPFSSPIVQSTTSTDQQSITTISWGQSENPSYVYDPYADCTTCFSDPFKSLVLFFQRYKNIGNGVIQVDFLINNFNHNRGIDYWNVPFVGIRNSSLPYAFVSNSNSNNTTYNILNTKPGHPAANDPNSYLPEFKTGAVVKTSGNNSASSGWFAFSNSNTGNGPSLAFVTAKSTNNPNNGYGDFRYGTAMSNPTRDVTILTRRAIGGAADPISGLKPWGIIGGESIVGRYFIVVDQSIDSLVGQITNRKLTENAFIEKKDLVELDSNKIHYQFVLDENNEIVPVDTIESEAVITLNSKPFTGAYPVFKIQTNSQTVLCSDPYHFSNKPYDGIVIDIELLGFQNGFLSKTDIQPIITSSHQQIDSSTLLFPNPSNTSISFSNSLSKITNTEGKVVFFNRGLNTVNISNWNSGLYFAEFENGEVLKFIKK